MDEELKPCPFCGNTNTMRQSISGTMQHPAYLWIHCEECGASGPWVTGTVLTPEAAWNKRAPVCVLPTSLEDA